MMIHPRVEVLGVYRLPLTSQLLEEQIAILYGDAIPVEDRVRAERHCREQLSSVVLIEAVVRNRDATFDVGHFTQPQDGVPSENWQVAWAEAYLTSDGEALAVERWSVPPPSGDLRLAFFLHYWDRAKPLRCTYGDVACPAVEDMPERLARLVPYEPLD